MHASELKERAILALGNAQVVGHVDEPLFDAQYANLIGFRLKHGPFGTPQAVLRDAITTIGLDALTIADAAAVKPETEIPALSGAVPLKTIVGTKMVSEKGEVVGVIQDITLDDDVRHAVGYLLPPNSLVDRLRHVQTQIPANRAVQIGAGGVMTIADTTSQESQQSI